MFDADRPNHLEHWVHWSLMLGLAISGTLLILGLAITLIAGQSRPAGPPPSFSTLLAGARLGDGVSLLNLGLLILLATPMLRVAVLAAGWAFERSWRFASVALLVLALLILSLSLGLG